MEGALEIDAGTSRTIGMRDFFHTYTAIVSI